MSMIKFITWRRLGFWAAILVFSFMGNNRLTGQVIPSRPSSQVNLSGPPTLICPPNRAYHLGFGEDELKVNFKEPYAQNPLASPWNIQELNAVKNGSLLTAGSYQQSYSAQDPLGNQYDCSFLIRVVGGTENPVSAHVTAKAPQNLCLGGNCNVVATRYTRNILISQYRDGGESQDMIEVFNGTGEDVDLEGYTLAVHAGGRTDLRTNIPFGALKLAAGEVILIRHPSAPASLTLTLVSSDLYFDGNDAIALYQEKDSIEYLVDLLGNIGNEDGSDFFSPEGLTTKGTNLKRKDWVFSGIRRIDTTLLQSVFPAFDLEWEDMGSGLSGIGSHQFSGIGDVHWEKGEYVGDTLKTLFEPDPVTKREVYPALYIERGPGVNIEGFFIDVFDEDEPGTTSDTELIEIERLRMDCCSDELVFSGTGIITKSFVGFGVILPDSLHFGDPSGLISDFGSPQGASPRTYPTNIGFSLDPSGSQLIGFRLSNAANCGVEVDECLSVFVAEKFVPGSGRELKADFKKKVAPPSSDTQDICKNCEEYEMRFWPDSVLFSVYDYDFIRVRSPKLLSDSCSPACMGTVSGIGREEIRAEIVYEDGSTHNILVEHIKEIGIFEGLQMKIPAATANKSEPCFIRLNFQVCDSFCLLTDCPPIYGYKMRGVNWLHWAYNLPDGLKPNCLPWKKGAHQIVRSAILRIAPNPSQGPVSIYLEAKALGKHRLRLMDAQGKPLKTIFNGQLAPGESRDFSLNPDQSGLRLLQLQEPTGQVRTLKLIQLD